MDGADRPGIRAPPPTRDRARLSSQLASRVVGRRVGPRHAGGGIDAGAQLAITVSHTAGVGAGVLDVERVERQPGGLQPLVVAGDAVG